jgi:hypothetical protein
MDKVGRGDAVLERVPEREIVNGDIDCEVEWKIDPGRDLNR